MNNYMVVETTRLTYPRTYNLQSEEDIQNGAIVGKGDLIDNENDIYAATADITNGMYLVANPAWNYDEPSVEYTNEESYINEAGKPYRAYQVQVNDRFAIYNIADTFAVGDYVAYDATTGKYAVSEDSQQLKVVQVVEMGFPYCIGSEGTLLDTSDAEMYGYVVSGRTTKYVIERVA